MAPAIRQYTRNRFYWKVGRFVFEHLLAGARQAHKSRALPGLAGLIALALTACAGPQGAALQPATTAAGTPAGAVQPASNPHAGNAGTAGQELPAVNLDAATMFQLLASEIAAQRGQPATAYATYMSLALKTGDPRLARRALEIALREQNLESALESARMWSKLAPADPQASQSLTVLLISRGELAEAKPRLIARFKTDKEVWQRAMASGRLPDDNPYELAQRQVVRAPDKAAAYRLLLDVFADDMKAPGALRVLAAQAHFAGNPVMAIEHARQLVRLDPSAGPTLLLAQYQQQQVPEGIKASIATLEAFLKKTPGHLEVSTALARLYTVDQQWDKARSLFEPLLTADPDNSEILYILSGLAVQQNDRLAAGRYFGAYLEKTGDSDERDTTAMLLSLAQMAEDDKDYATALKWLSAVGNPAATATVRIRTALIQSKQGQADQALATLDAVKPASDAEKIQFTLTRAQILRDAERLEAASDVLAKGLTELPDQPDLLYEDAMLAEKLQRMDRVELNLRKVIALRPDNPHAYNALGYSFADRNTRLDEAKVLIDKAIELAPNDAFIMDSLGWVLFRQGRSQEALEILKKAYQIKPDPEIAIHIGEVLWTLGDGESAMKILRSVKDNAATAATLKQTLGRLGIGGL
jgi:tetratricopeptide (TPR) repeat protein